MVHFAVVEFSEDHTVEVVPSNWIVDDVCLWPPLRGLRFTAAAKKCETPTDLWLKYPIRVINTYENYDAARGRLQHREEVDDLPDSIKDKIPMQTLADTRHMGSIGGKDVADTTRNVLRNLMANTVASRMNFVGRGGKIAIKNMKMLHVITGAVRRNKLLKGATNAEIETVVKLWLRYTCDRSGGRQHRYEKQSQRVQTYSDMESD